MREPGMVEKREPGCSDDSRFILANRAEAGTFPKSPAAAQLEEESGVAAETPCARRVTKRSGTADLAIEVGQALLEHLGVAGVAGRLDLLQNAGAGQAKGFTVLSALEFVR